MAGSTATRLKAWKNIATSAAMQRVDPSWLPQPHAAHLLVTWRCNLKCVHCPSWQMDSGPELSAQEWRAALSQIRSLDIVKVLGGEPFVRADIVEILRAIREEVDPYILQLTTNGMLTERVVEAVQAVAWPGLQLRISVDGRPDTHDRQRGVDGSWRRVDATVQAVSKLRQSLDFRFGINFAVTDDSIDELEAMAQYASQYDADLIPGVNVDPFLTSPKPPEEMSQRLVGLSDPNVGLDAIEHAKTGTRRQLPSLDHLVSKALAKGVGRQQLLTGRLDFPCRELRDLIYLLPNGDLVRCGMDHRPIGNLKRQRFEEIWYGQSAQTGRQRVDDCPGCLQSSVQILSRMYAGSPQ